MGLKLSASWAPGALEARLQQIGNRAIEGGADELRKYAQDIMDLAVDIAPHKSGDLENAIYWDEEEGDVLRDALGRFAKGNRRIDVFVTVDTDQTVHHGFQYAGWAHRMITPYGPKQLGPGSQEKQDTNRSGLPVGGGYIRRAAEALMGPLKRALKRRVRSEIR